MTAQPLGLRIPRPREQARSQSPRQTARCKGWASLSRGPSKLCLASPAQPGHALAPAPALGGCRCGHQG